MTTPKCQRCDRESPNAFLCPHCADHLRETLRELPWWLDKLFESAVGQVRLGDGGKRAHDPGLLKYTGQNGDERLADDLAQGEITVAKLAATGRANAAASNLYNGAHNTLATWIRDICESRGVTYLAPRELVWNFIGPLRPTERRQKRPKDPGNIETTGTHTPMAMWLIQHVSAIVMHEAAGECANDIEDLRLAVERAVNRREAPMFCGLCPNELADDHAKDCDKGHPHECGTRLEARKKAANVTCPSCKATHDVETLQRKIFEDNADYGYTSGEIHTVMNAMGMSIGESTLRRWIARRELVPMNWHSGSPKYHLGDVKKLREKGQHATTKR
jgi:hypothetical protein